MGRRLHVRAFAVDVHHRRLHLVVNIDDLVLALAGCDLPLGGGDISDRRLEGGAEAGKSTATARPAGRSNRRRTARSKAEVTIEHVAPVPAVDSFTYGTHEFGPRDGIAERRQVHDRHEIAAGGAPAPRARAERRARLAISGARAVRSGCEAVVRLACDA